MIISNTDSVIDSRDIIKRIEDLKDELLDCTDEAEAREADLLEEWQELKVLQAVAAEGEQYAPDWSCGETLIHEDYFTEYCKELTHDIGAYDSNLPSYIENNIDWDGVADDLKVDYTDIDFDGETYYIR